MTEISAAMSWDVIRETLWLLLRSQLVIWGGGGVRKEGKQKKGRKRARGEREQRNKHIFLFFFTNVRIFSFMKPHFLSQYNSLVL